MPLSPEQDLFIQKISDAVNYCMKEADIRADISLHDAIGSLEIIKLELFHKLSHCCRHCGNQTSCNHCNHDVP